MLPSATAGTTILPARAHSTKPPSPGSFTPIPLPLLNFLPHLLRLLLVRKRETNHTPLPLKGMKKSPVLEILELLINLHVPDYASSGVRCDVDEFEPEGVAYQVVGED